VVAAGAGGGGGRGGYRPGWAAGRQRRVRGTVLARLLSRRRIAFGTEAYLGAEAFCPEVVLVFRVADPAAHYHVPLLLSPFAYSTYRGS
jgi:HIUase/Transthyretin family